jgi:acyl dehydratase
VAIQVGQVKHFKRRFTQEDFNRFADLTGDNNPIHVDPEFSSRTRFGRTVAHGMMLYSTICRMLSTQLPGPGVLQIKQEMMFQHPTFTDTEITVRFEVSAVHPEKQRAIVQTDIRLPDGQSACTGKTLIHLPGWKGGFPGVDERMAVEWKSEAPSLKVLKIGQSAFVTRTINAADLAEYTDLTGDTNPLFNDADYAHRLGFRDRLIPGPMLSGMFSNLLGTKLPGRGTNWLKQSVYFPAPAYVDDEITATVEITRLRPEKDLVYLRDTCANSAGETVCQAQSLVLVKDLA